jgi:hypothetical protein
VLRERRRGGGGGGGGGVSSLSQCGLGLKKEFCEKFCSFGIVVAAAAVEREFFSFCKVLSLSFFFVCFPSIISFRMLLVFSFPVCNVSLVLAAGS